MLSDHFAGVGVKRLAAVDTLSGDSNQHEVTGSVPLIRILGDQDRKFPRGGADDRFHATYIWMGEEQEALTEEGHLSWYDSRRNKRPRTEWRLYYQSNSVTELMKAGDVVFVARKHDDHLLFIVTPEQSTIQNQLLWLFGITAQPGFDFVPRELRPGETAELSFAARYILDELGVEPEEPDVHIIDAIIRPFGLKFPKMKEFSEAARRSLTSVSPLEDPDAALVAWMDREEQMFRRLERLIVADRIQSGFSSSDGADVDGFLSFSLSVQNRRKSRAGAALEDHLEALLKARGLKYARGAETENGNRPDFLFPGPDQYRSPSFKVELLTMLGAKSTLKDRWRQVLSEAERIKRKHLITLEPGVSENQTNEMRAKDLQLVVPESLHLTYKPAQQAWLFDVETFLRLVEDRQRAASD